MAPNPLPTPEPIAPTPVVVGKRQSIVTTIVTMSDTPPTATPTQAKSDNKAIIGPVVGGLVGGVAAGLFVFLFWLFLVRRRKSKQAEARAALSRRRARQVASMHTRRKSTTSSAGSSAHHLKPTSPSEKNFDPHVPVTPPQRTYAPKSHDPFVNEKGYGYEPKPLAYVPVGAGGEYFVQQAYEEPLTPPAAEPQPLVQFDLPTNDTPSTSTDKSSPPTSPPTGAGDRTSRGASRIAAAELAVASATAPITKRHRPKRPSPLAKSDESEGGHMPANDFTEVRPGYSLDNSPINSPPSSSGSHAANVYAAAAGGSWGIALGSPEEDETITFADEQEKAIANTRAVLDAAFEERKANEPDRSTKGSSGMYSHDPFAEYHAYMSGRPDSEMENLFDNTADSPPHNTSGRKPIDWI
ncbi:hypothetical protein Q8F55_000406 [Vanrija albida]|uniref:Uncharacterized protein n=1 Tax=Vanrija albida TaxID=181172 RepID=A0ABR3QD63_9TREE